MNRNFRHCRNENIEVYTAEGGHPLEAVRYLVRGLKGVEKESGSNMHLSTITVEYDSFNDTYHALAFVYGASV